MSNLDTIPAGITIFGLRAIQGAAEKSNSLTCFANSLATDYNFLMKLCIDIVYISARNFHMLFNNLEI